MPLEGGSPRAPRESPCLCHTPAAYEGGGRNVSSRRVNLHERQHRRGVAGLGAIAILAVVLSACGGGGDSEARVINAGPVDIKLPPGYKVVNNTVIAPRDTAPVTPSTAVSTAAGAGGSVPTTPTTAAGGVPLDNNKDPTTEFMTAFGKFRSCLNDEHVKFIGPPDASNPASPTNDPDYLKSLGTCAARSNIVQALKDAAASEENLTPAQIKERNKGYLNWRKCMINRGWTIPKPTPDSQGRLFSFSNTGSQQQIKGPGGKDAFSSDDIQQCTARAQAIYAKTHPNYHPNG